MTNLKFTWTNIANANDYVVFENAFPTGTFTTQTGTAASGATGLTVPIVIQNWFYLVAGRHATCGVGPLN